MATPNWNAFATRAFVEICKDETIAGNRPSGWLSTIGYNNLETKFFERTGQKFTRKQFKNKWDFMKKDYVLWVELNNSATGLGRCSIRKTVDALNEWWNMQIGLNKEFAKFRDGPPANLECLDVMFDNAYVTGAIAIVPRMVLGGEASPILLEGSGSSADPAGEELTGSGQRERSQQRARGKKITTNIFKSTRRQHVLSSLSAHPPSSLEVAPSQQSRRSYS